MDEQTPPGWGLDDDVQVAVLLDAARRMMIEGDYQGAVGLAEELLDSDPDDIDALLLVADAAPRFGHGEVGVLAARQAGARGADARVFEAAGLLAACQIESALALAEDRLGSRPDDARAHAIRGQALEVLGRLDDADHALARAHALRPDAYPLPLPVEAGDWDSFLLQALARLDPPDRALTNLWRFDVFAAPRPEVLRTHTPPVPPSVPALVRHVEGATVCELYTRALTRGCLDDDELVERLRAAIVDELAHLEA